MFPQYSTNGVQYFSIVYKQFDQIVSQFDINYL